MLHESKLRVASPLDINAPEIVRLGWKGAESGFKPDARYQLVGTDTFDKQVVHHYVAYRGIILKRNFLFVARRIAPRISTVPTVLTINIVITVRRKYKVCKEEDNCVKNVDVEKF